MSADLADKFFCPWKMRDYNEIRSTQKKKGNVGLGVIVARVD